MGNDAFHPDRNRGQTRQGSAGMDTFVQTQNLREMIDRIKFGRFVSWEKYEGAGIIFIDKSKQMAYLGQINRARHRGRTPNTSPELRNRLNQMLDMGLNDLAHSGRTDLGPIGLMLGEPDKGPGMDIHEFGETPDEMTMLISKVYFKRLAGYDIILIGDRGVGKTNIGNNYMQLPWMRKYGLPVISAVPIENADHFNENEKLFQDFPYKSMAVSAICDIRLRDIENHTRTGILSFNDESGILTGRSKTQSNMVHNQTVFCYISRHFRLTSIWTYQLPQDVPNKILDLATQVIHVDSHQYVRRVVQSQDRGELVQKFYGWDGWEGLKRRGNRGQYIQYKDDTPSTQMWNLDVIELLAVVGKHLADLYSKSVDREREFFKAVKSYADSCETYQMKGKDTKKHFLKHACVTFGLINEKLFFDNEGNIYVEDGNMSAKYKHVENKMKLTGTSLAYLLEPLGMTPNAIGQMFHALYDEIRHNPGMFKANSELTPEEEGAIDGLAERLGVAGQLEDAEG
jgi:hypothetical protein